MSELAHSAVWALPVLVLIFAILWQARGTKSLAEEEKLLRAYFRRRDRGEW